MGLIPEPSCCGSERRSAEDEFKAPAAGSKCMIRHSLNLSVGSEADIPSVSGGRGTEVPWAESAGQATFSSRASSVCHAKGKFMEERSSGGPERSSSTNV